MYDLLFKSIFPKLLVIFLFSILLSFLSIRALATPPNLSQKHLTLRTEVNYLSTNANFDREGGGIEDLPNNNSYQRWGLKTSALYTFATDLAFDLGLEFARSQSSDALEERTNLQLTEFHGKLLYQLSNQPFEIIPEAAVVIPFNRVDQATDDVLTGEGALQAHLGSWAVWDLNIAYIYAFAAYNYRDEGRSHTLPWRLGAEFDFNGFYLGGEASGIESLTDDKYTNDATQRTRVTNRVNAGSLTYYSVNPQQISASAWVSFDISKYINTRLAYTQAINGRESGVDKVFTLVMDIKLDMTNNTPKSRSYIERTTKKTMRQFEVEDDKFDETLFDKRRQRQHRIKKLNENRLLNETERQLERQQ